MFDTVNTPLIKAYIFTSQPKWVIIIISGVKWKIRLFRFLIKYLLIQGFKLFATVQKSTLIPLFQSHP